jgi:hypothetical protein
MTGNISKLSGTADVDFGRIALCASNYDIGKLDEATLSLSGQLLRLSVRVNLSDIQFYNLLVPRYGT